VIGNTLGKGSIQELKIGAAKHILYFSTIFALSYHSISRQHLHCDTDVSRISLETILLPSRDAR